MSACNETTNQCLHVLVCGCVGEKNKEVQNFTLTDTGTDFTYGFYIKTRNSVNTLCCSRLTYLHKDLWASGGRQQYCKGKLYYFVICLCRNKWNGWMDLFQPWWFRTIAFSQSVFDQSVGSDEFGMVEIDQKCEEQKHFSDWGTKYILCWDIKRVTFFLTLKQTTMESKPLTSLPLIPNLLHYFCMMGCQLWGWSSWQWHRNIDRN